MAPADTPDPDSLLARESGHGDAEQRNSYLNPLHGFSPLSFLGRASPNGVSCLPLGHRARKSIDNKSLTRRQSKA